MGTLGVKMTSIAANSFIKNLRRQLIDIHIDYGIDNILVAGSVRRGKLNEIGDIDIIIVAADDYKPKEFSEYLKSNLNFKIDAAGSKLIRAISESGIQVDFYFCNELQLPYMLAYLTGPQEFNIGMRSQARKLGYKLNQFSLIDTETGVEIQGIESEQQLFNFLGLKFIEPNRRGSWYQNYRDYKLDRRS